jgi:hypothetical protein
MDGRKGESPGLLKERGEEKRVFFLSPSLPLPKFLFSAHPNFSILLMIV